MKVCIIGDGLVSLTLAKMLIQKDILVEILSEKENSKYDKSRTLGISKSNIDFFNKEILNINNILWNIRNIKVYTEKNLKEEILNFKNNKQIFSIVKNFNLQKLLFKNLKKSKLIRFKKVNDYKNLIKQKYNLIINCNSKHEITKKFFFRRLEKNYNSFAYTTIIFHKETNNNTAFQYFTKNGPIAFLPISENQTSVVYSFKSRNKIEISEIKKLIHKYNPMYDIKKIDECSCFKLKASNLRQYYKDNILAFGDLLHSIHPLAGQGFNMSLRDIKLLSSLIDKKMNLGLDIDRSICHDFTINSQDKNFLFSSGIDLIYELFNFESKINSDILSKSIYALGKNKFINSSLQKFADKGLGS